MAISFEVDGKYTGAFAKWEEYDRFFSSLTRFLIPHQKESVAVLNAERLGHQVRLTLLADPDMPIMEELETVVFYGKQLEKMKKIPLRLMEEGVYQGLYAIEDSSPHYHVSRLNNTIVRGNAVTLPYSPEFDKSLDSVDKNNILDRIVEITGGKKFMMASPELFENATPVIQKISLLNFLLLFTMIFLVLDILYRQIGFRLKFSTHPKKAKTEEKSLQEPSSDSQESNTEESPADPFAYAKAKGRR